MLTSSIKFNLLRIEATVAVHVGTPLKAGDSTLEGDTFEFITGYDTVVGMATALRNPMTSELRAALEKIAISCGATEPAATASPAPAADMCVALQPSTALPVPSPHHAAPLRIVIIVVRTLGRRGGAGRPCSLFPSPSL